MNRRRDDPVPLGDAVAAVAKDLGMPPPDALRAIEAAWPDIVGAALAQHATVESLRDGDCVVRVDGPAWATQLRYAAADVTARINECCGPGTAVSLRVLVRRP